MPEWLCSTSAAVERRAWDQLDFFYKKGLAYANEMGLRPQTLYAIADSPVGLAAWILDHDKGSYELIVRVFDGKPEGLTRDDICDNISMYWLTNTAISSARLYWTTRARSKGGGFFDTRGVKLPVIVSAFPDEITPPRRAGRSAPTRSCCSTASTPGALTTRRGSNPRRSCRTCARGSSRCGESEGSVMRLAPRRRSPP